MCRATTSGGAIASCSHRLPRAVLPESYDLTLFPDIESSTFRGDVAIKVHVSEPVSEIILNSAELSIEGAALTRADGTTLAGAVTLDAEHERATIRVAGSAGRGEWVLKLKFSGVLGDKLRGFYKSSSRDGNHSVACTQFEAVEARHAFPCFDEPDMKASFNVSLVVDENKHAVSNMSIVSEKPHDGHPGKKLVTFAPTFKMSTYLAAFVAGDLEFSEPVDVDGTQIRIVTLPGKTGLGKFGLSVAAFAMRYLRSYFGVPYPGDKIDLVAVPDFEAGAMENPGCIIFAEDALLVDLESASQEALERIAATVAHELAHLWFGDLVTMTWWRYLWLNEAFATLMENKVVDAWKKDWEFWLRFGLSRRAAMSQDALVSTRPVEFPVNHPSDADAMFDILTYQKGCSVLRMLECYLGEKTFRQGIVLYMQRHAFGNTEGHHLWSALEESSGLPVGKIMREWILEPGFPVVSVRDGALPATVVLSQKPFRYLGDAAGKKITWSIPVFLKAKCRDGEVQRKLLLETEEETVYIGEEMEHLVVNADGHSFIRVSYSDRLSGLVLEHLNLLSPIEKFNLLSDAWACCVAGLLTGEQFIERVKRFSAERDPNFWSVAISGLTSLHGKLESECRSVFAAEVRLLLSPILRELGWSPAKQEDHKASELRGQVIEALGYIGNDPEVRREARRRYDGWKSGTESLDPNIVGAVLHLCAMDGDKALYEEFLHAYKQARTPQDENHFLSALTWFQDRKLLERTLSECLSPDGIPNQDAPYTVAQVMANEAATHTTWEFVKNNWYKLVERFPEGAFIAMCEGVITAGWADMVDEIKSFFADREVRGGKQAVRQALETLEISAEFYRREAPRLASRYPLPAPPDEDTLITPPPGTGDSVSAAEPLGPAS